jgi:hypothetical protein
VKKDGGEALSGWSLLVGDDARPEPDQSAVSQVIFSQFSIRHASPVSDRNQQGAYTANATTYFKVMLVLTKTCPDVRG